VILTEQAVEYTGDRVGEAGRDPADRRGESADQSVQPADETGKATDQAANPAHQAT
jgi:hypothetical protein